MNNDEKKALEDAKNQLIRATKLISDILESKTEKNPEELEDWMKDRVAFWCKIYNEGEVVTKDRAHQIWKDELKKDVRGFGGFFVGKGASLQWTAKGLIVLTYKAKESIEAWTGKSIEEYAKRFEK